MQLVGMLDSPFVRRAAISLQLLDLPFEHRSISVFREVDKLQRINPVVKVPSLICDDGTVLMDSTLILDYAQTLATSGRRLMPAGVDDRRRALRTIGLALAACDKCAQVIYERMRPTDKQHEPWLARLIGQLAAAFDALESELERRPPAVASDTIDDAVVTTAVAWRFAQVKMPELVDAKRYPALRALSSQAECLPEFMAAPCSEAVYPVVGPDPSAG